MDFNGVSGLQGWAVTQTEGDVVDILEITAIRLNVD